MAGAAPDGHQAAARFGQAGTHANALRPASDGAEGKQRSLCGRRAEAGGLGERPGIAREAGGGRTQHAPPPGPPSASQCPGPGRLSDLDSVCSDRDEAGRAKVCRRRLAKRCLLTVSGARRHLAMEKCAYSVEIFGSGPEDGSVCCNTNTHDAWNDRGACTFPKCY